MHKIYDRSILWYSCCKPQRGVFATKKATQCVTQISWQILTLPIEKTAFAVSELAPNDIHA